MTNAAGDLYATHRIMADLAELIRADPEVITTMLADRVQRFADGSEADDDMTILALRRT